MPGEHGVGELRPLRSVKASMDAPSSARVLKVRMGGSSNRTGCSIGIDSLDGLRRSGLTLTRSCLAGLVRPGSRRLEAH